MDTPSTPARERVLDAAERLFSERGYAAVTLRDVAGALGMKQSSLYNHAPGGKEELFVVVLERGLARHRANLSRVIAEAPPTLRDQLRAAARWLLSQPPIDFFRLTRVDFPALAPAHVQRLSPQIIEALFAPLQAAVEQAYQRGETRLVRPALLASSFLVLMDALHDSHLYAEAPSHVIADDLIEMFLDGILRR